MNSTNAPKPNRTVSGSDRLARRDKIALDDFYDKVMRAVLPGQRQVALLECSKQLLVNRAEDASLLDSEDRSTDEITLVYRQHLDGAAEQIMKFKIPKLMKYVPNVPGDSVRKRIRLALQIAIDRQMNALKLHLGERGMGQGSAKVRKGKNTPTSKLVHAVKLRSRSARSHAELCKLLDLDRVELPKGTRWASLKTWQNAFNSSQHNSAVRTWFSRHHVTLKKPAAGQSITP